MNAMHRMLGMQFLIKVWVVNLILFMVPACQQSEESAQLIDSQIKSTSLDIQVPVQKRNEFPNKIVKLVLPLSGNQNKDNLRIPYSEGLIPQIGDRVHLENQVDGDWQIVSHARIFQINDEELLLKRTSGESSAAARATILANPVHRCDVKAASPLDNRAVMPGVEFFSINIGAIEFCGHAVGRYSSTARFHFQLGRALDAHHQEVQAVARYRSALALDSEYAAAMLALGGKYLNGDGVDRNLPVALSMLEQAHKLGLARATYLLGEIHEQDLPDFPAKSDVAAGYYLAAALAEDLPAQIRVADMYEHGQLLEINLVEAMNWREKAAQQGHLESQLKLAKAYAEGVGREQNWSQSFTWWEKAAHQGLPEAQLEVANIYEQGYVSGRPELNKAMYWYRQAAEQKYALGQYHLGRMYAEGIGVEKNMAIAREWLLLARAQGVLEASRWLAPEMGVLPLATVSDSPDVIKSETLIIKRENLRDVKRWRLETQGYMDAECREELLEELEDFGIVIVGPGEEAAITLIVTMNTPEFYTTLVGPFRFTGFNIQYRAEAIRKRDNIRLFYTSGEEAADDRSESCVDAVDEIGDELDDAID